MSSVMRRLAATATLALLLSGCASSYAWRKPDATAESQARDEVACHAEARTLTSEYATGGFGGPWNFSPWRRPWTGAYADPSWQAAAEQRVFESCMQGRGYDLVRVDKPR
jgi:ABC-type transport system substrate-binding protein